MRLELHGALYLLSLLAACFDASDARGARRTVVDSSAGTVALGLDAAKPYRPAVLTNPAELSGAVSFLRSPALDSARPDSAAVDGIAQVQDVARACGDRAQPTDSQWNGPRLANVLVWVEGTSSGKPLPEIRRETLTIEGCRFGPRLMAVVAPSTINVLSRDRAAHEALFYREGEGPIARVRTVDAGQVVPSEAVAGAPGIVEVRCAKHAWMRAYVAVFEHPYFAVTDAQGAFTIDSLPSGTYTVKVWHAGLAEPVAQRVVLRPGGAGRLDVAVTKSGLRLQQAIDHHRAEQQRQIQE